MSRVWSKFIQTTDELYLSRDMRFNDLNKNVWLDAIGAKSGDRVLEIGCAGGTFCHKLKKYQQDIDITGIDLDLDHIDYAKKKAAELSLDCSFIQGDATKLPFEENSFDLCFSHTVAEHIPHDGFFGEQYRVLRAGGRIVVMSVRTKFAFKDYKDEISDEENYLMELAWSNTENFYMRDVGAYEMNETEYPKELQKYGFKDVKIQFFTAMEYCPDSSDVSKEMALDQINARRFSQLSSIDKLERLNRTGLKDGMKEKLIRLINKRFDDRIEKYLSAEKVWDMATTAVLCVSGKK